MSFIESIQNTLVQGKFTAGVFVDLKKAFGTVDHDSLIDNFEQCGFRGVIV